MRRHIVYACNVPGTAAREVGFGECDRLRYVSESCLMFYGFKDFDPAATIAS